MVVQAYDVEVQLGLVSPRESMVRVFRVDEAMNMADAQQQARRIIHRDFGDRVCSIFWYGTHKLPTLGDLSCRPASHCAGARA